MSEAFAETCAFCGTFGCVGVASSGSETWFYCAAHKDQNMSKRNGKTNGAAETAGIDQTEEMRAQITARAVVDALGGEHGDLLRAWLLDTIDDIGIALRRFSEDPEGARRELQGIIAFALNMDPDLLDQLADRVEGKWPEDVQEVDRETEERDAEIAEAGDEPADQPAPAADTPIAHARPPRAATLAARQLKGDLTRYVLDLLQHEQGDRRPWSERTEAQQRRTIEQVGERVEDALRTGFALMIADRARVVSGTLDSVTAKEDGIKAVVKLKPDQTNIMTLLAGAGEDVQIAVADPTAFLGMGEAVPVVLDQHAMPLETTDTTATEAHESVAESSAPMPRVAPPAMPAEPPAVIQ